MHIKLPPSVVGCAVFAPSLLLLPHISRGFVGVFSVRACVCLSAVFVCVCVCACVWRHMFVWTSGVVVLGIQFNGINGGL
jgi:hypothetical protein